MLQGIRNHLISNSQMERSLISALNLIDAGKFDESKKKLDKATVDIELKRKKSPKLLALIFLGKSRIKQHDKKMDMAYQFADMSLDQAFRAADIPMILQCLVECATCQKALRRLDDVIKTTDRGLKVLKTIETPPRDVATMLFEIRGDVYKELGKDKDAEDAYEQKQKYELDEQPQ